MPRHHADFRPGRMMEYSSLVHGTPAGMKQRSFREEHPRMSDYRSRTEVPALAREALRLAQEMGFANSCIEEVGRLLAVLTRQVQHGVVGEVGAGCGVGAAWIAGAIA